MSAACHDRELPRCRGCPLSCRQRRRPAGGTVLDWLDAPVFHALGETTTWAELLGFLSGLLCVWLVVRQHIANWPVGILNVLLLMVVFLRARLFGDAML